MKKLFVANWKLYCDYDKTIELAQYLSAIESELEFIVAPATPFLSEVAKIVPKKVAAGRCGIFTEGAHTGAISIADLKVVGATFILIGHSESRARGETEEEIRTKIELARTHHLTPIFCVGESLDERRNDESEKAIATQLESLDGDFSNLIIAYEPVWAISDEGKGVSASGGDTVLMHTFIKKIAVGAKVIYGGSVNSKNCKEICLLPEVDGVLVGHASTVKEELTCMLSSTN